MGCDFLLANTESLFFPFLTEGCNAEVIGCCNSYNGAKRGHNAVIVDGMGTLNAFGKLKTLAGFNNHLLSALAFNAVGVKEIGLAATFEFYTNNINQSIFLISIRLSRH